MAFRNHIFKNSIILWLMVFSVGCSDTDPGPSLTPYQESVVSYFKVIALGFENGNAPQVTRKWNTPMRLFVGGDLNDDLDIKISETVNELNSQFTDGFMIELTEDTVRSNAYLYFGGSADFINLFPNLSSALGSNFGLFNVWIGNRFINRAIMFVETKRATPTQQSSILVEEITQSLGLGRDSPRFSDSIFFETSTDGGFAQELSQRDKDLVRLLYHPRMQVGLNADGVDPLLRSIIAEINL